MREEEQICAYKNFYIATSPMLLIPVEFSTLNKYLLMQGFGKDEELHFDTDG